MQIRDYVRMQGVNQDEMKNKTGVVIAAGLTPVTMGLDNDRHMCARTSNLERLANDTHEEHAMSECTHCPTRTAIHAEPHTPETLKRFDLTWVRFAAAAGVETIGLTQSRSTFQASARLRQNLLFPWNPYAPGHGITNPNACLNFAVAPTLVYGMLAVKPRLEISDVLTVHCIGATNDFEGRADWSQLADMLKEARFPHCAIEITYIGDKEEFAAPGVFTRAQPPPSLPGVTVKSINKLYHNAKATRPDIALICHPGFDNYLKDWHRTMADLFRQCIPVIVSGHSNFHSFSHDALMQDIELEAFGAKIIQRQIWNPFCQAYTDPTKGSLLAPPGCDHDHCNLATISIFRGGCARAFKHVDAVFDILDYMVQALHALPPFIAKGPLHRSTGLALKYTKMTNTQREAVLKLTREMIGGTTQMQFTEAGLTELLSQRGVADHFRLGRGNW